MLESRVRRVDQTPRRRGSCGIRIGNFDEALAEEQEMVWADSWMVMFGGRSVGGRSSR